ncbi:MAG: hypothetical protein R3293_21635 [Candidatus Promineifilaceae bacterium]|nr:hypothetical protein [Candidatus Promineifilaceae bacterium]
MTRSTDPQRRLNFDRKIAKWVVLGLLTIIALLLLGYFLQVALQITDNTLGAPLDDAWIHFQFARNLSQGNGFSFNAGEPTPGSTAPLWTVLLAVVGLFSSDFLLPALILSSVFLLVAIWLTFGFTQWITGSFWAALLAALGTTFIGRLLWAGLAGMETTAFAALSLGAIFLYSKRGLRPSTALLFAAATQFRPEGHALFALALADSLWQWKVERNGVSDQGWSSFVRSFLPPLIVYALICAPYILFSLSTTGYPLPNTFYAKSGSEHLFSIRTLRETLGLHWRDNPFGLLLLLLGLTPLWKKSRLGVLWLLGLPLFTAIIIDFTWHHGRYTLPLIPLQMVTAAVGAHLLVTKVRESKFIPKQNQRKFVSQALIVVLYVLLVFAGAASLPNWAMMLGNNTREILDIDVAQGRWLAKNTSPDAVIAVDDIGAIGFLSERRIIDLNGLVTPEVWPAVSAEEGLERNQKLTRILSELGPDLMAAFPLWRWDIVTNRAVAQPLHHVQTDTHTIIFQQDAYIYEMTWPYLDETAPDNPLEVTFGRGIKLLGYDFSEDDSLSITLYWTSIAPVSENYDAFIHLVDKNKQIVAQTDDQPVGGLAATNLWRPGDIIRDSRTVTLPENLPTGTYELHVGVYLRESGQRLPISSEDAVDNALILSSIALP